MKRIVIVLFCLLPTVLPLTVSLTGAQEVGKVYRIGYLSNRGPRVERNFLPAFQEGLRELGYVEGKNIVVEYRWAKLKLEHLPALAAELLRHKVELIVTGGGAAAGAAQQASKTIPIVMAEATSPVARGLVQSLARPGGNTTGLSLRPPEVFGKWLELLREIVPNLSRAAVLWNPKGPASRLGWKAIQSPARKLGVQLHSMKVRNPNDLDKAFQDAIREGAEGLVSTPGVMRGSRKRIVEFAAKSRLPAIYPSPHWVKTGGLMGYGARISDLYRRAATYVDKILKGAKPGDLPVEQPRKFDLVINLKTAKEIGITIPPEMLYRADKVIR